MDVIEFWKDSFRRSIYLDEEEFEHIYVRKGQMAIRFADGSSRIVNCLQIANVDAVTPRAGAFSRLLARIDRELNVPVFVENITFPEAAAGLAKKYGFVYVNDCGLDFCSCLFRDAPQGAHASVAQ